MTQMSSVLQDPLLLSRLTWHETEDLLVMEMISVTRRDPLLATGYLNIDATESELFRLYFRFEKADIRRLKSALLIPDVISTPQRVLVPGDEAVCITLHRLSYPNRLCELEQLFGQHYSAILLVTSSVLSHTEDNFVHLLKYVNNHKWLGLPAIEAFSQAVHFKGAPLHNCWGFIYGTARAIGRPSSSQKLFFSGHKRLHGVKYQSITCPNGIICPLSGPFFGSRHDAGILRKSKTYEKLQRLVRGHSYCLYGDSAYPLRPLLKW